MPITSTTADFFQTAEWQNLEAQLVRYVCLLYRALYAKGYIGRERLEKVLCDLEDPRPTDPTDPALAFG